MSGCQAIPWFICSMATVFQKGKTYWKRQCESRRNHWKEDEQEEEERRGISVSKFCKMEDTYFFASEKQGSVIGSIEIML